MKTIFLLLALTPSLFGAATCANLTIESVTDNSIRFSTNCTFTGPDAGFYYFMRATWGDNTYACPGAAQPSAGPCIQGQDTQIGSDPMGTGAVWVKTLTGLTCNTTYFFKTEVSYDTINWVGATAQATATTSACLSNPVLPTPPVSFTVPAPVPSSGGVARFVAPATHTSNAYGAWSTGASAPVAWAGTTSFVDEPDLQTAVLHASHTGGDIVLMNPMSVNPVGGTFASDPTGVLRPADTAEAGTITGFNTGTGVFTTSAPHGMSPGDYVRMAAGGGNTATAVPLPLNPGYQYCVLTVPTSTTFTIGATCAGSTVTGGPGLGINLCYATGGTAADIPSANEIIIRTIAPDDKLPPFGTTIDKTYLPQLAIIRNTVVSGAGGLSISFAYGCLAHHYRFEGIKFDWSSVATAGDPDPPAYYPIWFWTSTMDKSHIYLDRVYVEGGTNGYFYPDRTAKFSGQFDGRYMAVVNSHFENLGAWTPSNLYEYPLGGPYDGGSNYPPSMASSQTFDHGSYWRGWPIGYPGLPHPQCANVPTLTVGGTGVVVWEIDGNPTSCGNFWTATTGMTASATDSSGAANTVTFTGSPAYSTSSGRYTRYPVMTITVSSGLITGIAPVDATVAIGNIAGNDGPGFALSAQWGPGPYLIDNNTLDQVMGEFPLFFFTSDASGVLPFTSCLSPGPLPAGCALLQPPGDVTVSRNRITLDRAFSPSPQYNPLWNGQFGTMRQTAFETKEGSRIKITGNKISGGWCNNRVIAGTSVEIGNLNNDVNYYTTPTKVSDVEYSFNESDTTCGDAMQIVGYTTPSQSGVLTQRVFVHNNVFFNVDRIRNSAWNSPPLGGFSGNGNGIRFANGPQHVTFIHNTMDYLAGLFPIAINMQCLSVSGVYWANNFMGFSNDDGNGGMAYLDCGSVHNFPSGGASGGAAVTKTWVNYTFDNNWMLGGYSNSFNQTPLTNSQLTTIASSYSGLPGANFINPGSCNTITCRHADIGWLKPSSVSPFTIPWNPNNYLIGSGSSYLAGGSNHATDGKDIGVDTQRMTVEQGIVSTFHIVPPATAAFIAPTTDTCTVDWSSDNFANYHRDTPLNSPPNRVQSVALTSLPATGTALQARTNCTGVNSVVSFTAP